VIAAEEGVKPQTLEAFNAAEEAGTPVVVAFTKIDKAGADIERAKVSALEHGIYLEGLGGSIAYTGVSSKSGDGIPELLDLVLLTADLAELTADETAPAEGFVLESSQDPKQGQTATLILKNGTLSTGAFVVAGNAYAPVRFIENFAGVRIPSAGPSQPVRIAGWSSLPPAGTVFTSVATKKEAEKLATEGNQQAVKQNIPAGNQTEDGTAVLPLILKADVTGSLLAIKHEFAKIAHERVVIRIVSEGIGAVTEGDVKTAIASVGHIIAFNVTTDAPARDLAERSGVSIDTYSIIYELKERVESLVMAAAPHVTVEETLGEVKVLKTFNASGGKIVLGAKWVSGQVSLNDLVKLERRGIDLGRGKITNMQQARSDIKEIHTEGEFGMQIETKADLAGGDTVIAFRVVET
jgi:translation initiation factor IF-2